MYGAGVVPADCGIDHGYDREVMHKMGEVAFCKMISLDGRERQDADICGYGEDAGCILLTGTGDPESSSFRYLRAICEILPGTVAADLIASAGAAVISPDRTIGQQGIYQCV